MRTAILLTLLLPGCVFLGKAPPAAAPDSPPPTVNVQFGGMFGDQAVRTLWNNKIDRRGLMDRVVLDEDSFRSYDEDSGTEPWTLQLLLSRLGIAGTIVLTEPIGAPPPPQVQEDGTLLAALAPTAAIRNLRFLSGTEDIPAVVEAVLTGLQVRARMREEEESLCAPDFTLPVGFVFLRGTLQKLPLGEVVAVYDELAITPAPPETAVDLVLPSPDGPEMCETLAREWDENKILAQRDAGYILAASTVLDMALAPVLP